MRSLLINYLENDDLVGFRQVTVITESVRLPAVACVSHPLLGNLTEIHGVLGIRFYSEENTGGGIGLGCRWTRAAGCQCGLVANADINPFS